MESNRLFVSKDEKHFVNLYLDATVCEYRNASLIPIKKLSKMKNPDTVCFSDNGKKVALKSNNNTVEVYSLETMKNIFKGYGPRMFGGKMFFADDTTLLSSTEDGTIYTTDIITGNIKHFHNLNLKNVDIIQANKSEYFILANKENDGASIFRLTFENKETRIMLIYSSLEGMDTSVSCFTNNKLYSLSKNNELLIFSYDADKCLMALKDCISIFNEADVEQFTSHAFDKIHKSTPRLNLQLDPQMIAVGITPMLMERYIIIAFNYALIVFDIKRNASICKLPLSNGITSILTTAEGEHIWLSSPIGLQHILTRDILNVFEE